VKIGLLSQFFLLDQSGQPLIWGYFSASKGDELINPGEMKTLQDSLIYDGDAKKVKVFIDFDSVNSSLVSLADNELQQAITRFNNQQVQDYQRWLELQEQRSK
jgi:hypothetical protein